MFDSEIIKGKQGAFGGSHPVRSPDYESREVTKLNREVIRFLQWAFFALLIVFVGCVSAVVFLKAPLGEPLLMCEVLALMSIAGCAAGLIIRFRRKDETSKTG